MKYISNQQQSLPVQVAPVTDPIVARDEAHILTIYHTNPFQEVILVRTETNPMTGEVLSMREIIVSASAAARGFFNNVSPTKKGREELRPKAQRSYVYQKIGFVNQQRGIYQALSGQGQVNTRPQNPLSAAELFALLPAEEKAKLQAMLTSPPPVPNPETDLVDTPLFIDDEQPKPKRSRRKANEAESVNPLANL